MPSPCDLLIALLIVEFMIIKLSNECHIVLVVDIVVATTFLIVIKYMVMKLLALLFKLHLFKTYQMIKLYSIKWSESLKLSLHILLYVMKKTINKQKIKM